MDKVNQARVEQLGAVASVACAIHCAALPILFGAGAAGAVSWLSYEPVEWGLVLLAAVVGTVSAWRGFRQHGNLAVAVTLVVAAIGLVILTATHSGHGAHDHVHQPAWISAVFGVALGASLLINRRMCANCNTCAQHAAE